MSRPPASVTWQNGIEVPQLPIYTHEARPAMKPSILPPITAAVPAAGFVAKRTRVVWCGGVGVYPHGLAPRDLRNLRVYHFRHAGTFHGCEPGQARGPGRGAPQTLPSRGGSIRHGPDEVVIKRLPASSNWRDRCGRVATVEFSDNDGRTYALLALRGQQLMVLHHQPIQAA